MHTRCWKASKDNIIIVVREVTHDGEGWIKLASLEFIDLYNFIFFIAFNSAVCSSDYIALNGRKINKEGIKKDMGEIRHN